MELHNGLHAAAHLITRHTINGVCANYADTAGGGWRCSLCKEFVGYPCHLEDGLNIHLGTQEAIDTHAILVVLI